MAEEDTDFSKMRERLGQETKVSLDSPNLARLVLFCSSVLDIMAVIQ